MEGRVKDFLLKNSPGLVEDADSTIIYNELLELANTTVEKLPPKRKTVYKLSRHEGLSIKEIANRLDISSRTAENQLARALKYLKEELQTFSMLILISCCLF